MLEGSSAAIVIVTPQWELLDFNDPWSDFLGYEREELMGISPIELTHPDDRNSSSEKINQLISGEEEQYRIEKRYVRKNGDIVWGDLSAKAVRDGQGELEMIVATIVDVTNYKRIQTELANRIRELDFQKFAVDQHAIVSTADIEGKITYANDQFCEISGFSREELIGENHRIVKSDEHPPAFFQELWQTISSGTVWQGEIKNNKKNGGFYWTQATIVPFLRRNGKPFQYISIRTDITHRKEAEALHEKSESKFRAVTQSNQDAIISIDRNGSIFQWNQGAENIFGFSPDEIVGRSVSILVPERYQAAHEIGMNRYMETGKMHAEAPTIRIEAVRKDKSEFPIELSLSGWVVDGERFVTSIIRDISERKKAEDDLIAAKREAEEANRAKSRFLANMSHELRTPLNAIIGFSEVMIQEIFGPIEQRKYIGYAKDIHGSGKHLLSLISEILDMSKIEAREFSVHPQNLEIMDCIDEAMVFLKIQASNADVSVHIDIPVNLPLVHADVQATKQILINVLANAIKFTPKDGSVTVRATDGGDFLLVDVIDTGAGMAPEEIERAFLPFVQVEREKNLHHEGTGLGLPLSKNFAELQGGNLFLKSEKGKGTTATITLPVAESQV